MFDVKKTALHRTQIFSAFNENTTFEPVMATTSIQLRRKSCGQSSADVHLTRR